MIVMNVMNEYRGLGVSFTIYCSYSCTYNNMIIFTCNVSNTVADALQALSIP